MSKKTISIDIKKIIVLIIIIAIGVVIVNTVKNTPKEKSKMKELYSKLEASEQYKFTMDDGKNKTIIAQNGKNTIIDMYTEKEHVSTLVKDNNTYYILHDKEEYYTYEDNEKDEKILLSELQPIVEKEATNGKEKIQGKTYNYEEYDGVSTFMNYIGLGINTENIKTKFYFQGKNLKYIKTINDGEETLQKIDITYEAPSELFEIPNNYAENG